MPSEPPLRDDRAGALLSDDREYRYRLTRTWDAEKPTMAWIMLNPSTADETEDDPTIRRCIGFAKEWGYGSIVVGNLFAKRSPDPETLRECDDPAGPENIFHLHGICEDAELVVAAWGTNGAYRDRGKRVAGMLDIQLHALDVTQDGHPAHPLYQPGDAEPEPWDERALLDGGEEGANE